MRALQFLFKTSPAVLLLILCLRLGSGAAQDLVQEVISAKLTIDPVENLTNYYDVTVTVKSHVAKCIVVRVTLEDISNIIFPYGNFVYTACLCNFSTRNFFWEVQAPENGIIKAKAEVVSEENICPSDVEICSLVYKVCIKREIIIRC
ncbi:prolactin-inducible protein homolog [Moschus berezovskii]|uniref:prolactin-inducible protein homolog n=1 Tax=Moschus berezovskii TaxID=68408 RepID=UPI002443DFA1|nr:prolactin-inducible protein homolog [Moschus berezovskii]